jgi:hypothetical protein
VSPAMRMGPDGGCRSAAAAGDLLEAGLVPGDGLGGALGQVMPQVPAVSDLDRPGARRGRPRLSTHQPKVGLTELTMGGIAGQ